MIVEWRKPLEVEVDEGLSVCASDLDQQEDHPNKEQYLLKEREIRDPLTEAKFLLVRGEVQEVTYEQEQQDILVPHNKLQEDLRSEVILDLSNHRTSCLH